MSPFLQDISDNNGILIPRALAKKFHVSLEDFAIIIGLETNILTINNLIKSVSTQTRLNDMAKIIDCITPWCVNTDQACEWYRIKAIPSFGDATAMDLVKQNKGRAVLEYLERINEGGFS